MQQTREDNSNQDEDSDTLPEVNQDISQENQRDITPKVGEYWVIKNGETSSLYPIIVNEKPLSVNYFEENIIA